MISVSNNLNPSNFSVMYYNARSILPKMDELHVLVRAQNPSIVFIVESWISEDIQDCEISIEDYRIVRLDRNRHGGGIIIYIHVSLNWEVLLRGPNNLEFIALSISPVFSNVKHCVSVLYRPPSSPVSFFDDFCNTLHIYPPIFLPVSW